MHILQETCTFLQDFSMCVQPHNDQEDSACILLVVTYCPILPCLEITTRQHLNIFHTSKWLQMALLLPPLIAFCREKLRDLLVRAELRSNIHRPPGNWCCGAARCKTCPILMAAYKFASHMTSQQHKVKGNTLSPPMSQPNRMQEVWPSVCREKQVNPCTAGWTVIDSTLWTIGLVNPLCLCISTTWHT